MQAQKKTILYLRNNYVPIQVGTHLITLRKEIVRIEEIYPKQIDIGEYEVNLETRWHFKVRFLHDDGAMELSNIEYLDRCVVYKYYFPYWIAKLRAAYKRYIDKRNFLKH